MPGEARTPKHRCFPSKLCMDMDEPLMSLYRCEKCWQFYLIGRNSAGHVSSVKRLDRIADMIAKELFHTRTRLDVELGRNPRRTND